MYVSFTDASGNCWSLLFDSADAMRVMLMGIVAVTAHMNQRMSTTDCDFVLGMLPGGPSTSSAQPADETALDKGMTAGVFFLAWELGDDPDSPSTPSSVAEFDYPADLVGGAKPAFFSVVSPSEVAKVK